ncbi:hypothetical protein APUTEX25_003301 [Auxenochlorella protothecoides]|uniref:Uncharacterized protein n=1 Tax=Auxenochlorella protothecoides TaxID=3075 RepID=A0A3M7KUD0_AUXPR|nr:hypothetical protein APUTEX25_003301 [Auxenochlorella protothecoides]|eukprot:RMZ53479.1 hypothetical protein APUTEX25_003301 [Auxenochlorella protothecoides]
MSSLDQQRQFAEGLEDYLELHRAYVQVLEDLARSLQQIEPATPAKRTSSKALHRVLAKARAETVPSHDLESFIQGKEAWWDDAEVIRRLVSEPMSEGDGLDSTVPALLQQDALLMTEMLDRCSRETELVMRIQATVSLESDPATLSAQASILGLEPYLDAGALQTVASWLEARDDASPPTA